MRVGNASLSVSPGCEKDSGHVRLSHGATYSVTLGNHYHRPADVTLLVDGKGVGCFRVHAHGSVRIERPANDTGCFTFYRADSVEGDQAGAGSIARDERGLVQAQFRFARQAPQAVRTMSMAPKSSYGGEEKTSGGIMRGMSFSGEAKSAAGVTGLSGESSQQFVQVTELDYDPALDVNITVRLVADAAVRELRSVERSNPIPSAVE